MEIHLEQRHVLILDVADHSGRGAICNYRVLPELIADATPLDSGGARVAIALPGRDPLILGVTQSAPEINEAIGRAEALDGVGHSL